MTGPKYKIGILSRFNASHPVPEMKELCRIESDKLKCFNLIDSSVFDCFCCFLVKPSSHLIVIGMKAGKNALAEKDCGIICDPLINLVFIVPPVGEN